MYILLSLLKQSFCLDRERNMHRSSTNKHVYKQKQSRTALRMWVDFDVRGQQDGLFPLEELLWIMDLFWPEATV